MRKPCLFFDRDGVINEERGYITSWEQFAFRKGIFEVLETVKAKGYDAIVITNQRGVDLGLMSLQDLEDIHSRMQQKLNTRGLAFLDIFACTKGKEALCRKPHPTMILEAAKKHQLDLENALMIGDNDSDIECGHRAGVKTIRMQGNFPEQSTADYRVQDLTELHTLLEKIL